MYSECKQMQTRALSPQTRLQQSTQGWSAKANIVMPANVYANVVMLMEHAHEVQRSVA